MAKPFSILFPNGSINRYGEYYGTDTRSYASYMLYRKTKPIPWMTNRNGGWREFQYDLLRYTLVGPKQTPVRVNESDAFYYVTALSPGATSASSYAGGLIPYPSTANVVNCVRNKVKNSSINLPVFAAEAQKTSDMIGDTAKRLARAGLAIAHGKFGAAAGILGMSGTPRNLNKSQRGLRSIESNWLAYRYGWTPLLSDVSNAVDALTRSSLAGVSAVARCRRPFELQKRMTGVGYSCLVTTSGHVGAGVFYNCKNSTDFTSLGLTNPLELAWELLPYSFVVDWFIPIGNAISALDAFTNVNVVGSYNIVRYREELNAAYNVKRSDGYYLWKGVVRGYRNGMIRNVDVTGGSAVTTQIPTVQLNLNPKKLLDGIGLLHGAFNRKVMRA